MNKKIIVREWNSSDKEAYEEWLLENPNNLIYTTRHFLEFLEDIVEGKLVHLLAEEDGKIVGSFSYFQLYKHGLGTVLNSLPWYGSYGGCIVGKNSDIKLDRVREILLKHFMSACYQGDVLFSTVIISPMEQHAFLQYQRLIKPFAQDQRIGMITPLPEYTENLECKLEFIFKQKTRNLVRKSCKQGFKEIVTDEEWAWRFLFEVHHENITYLGGNPKIWKHFESIRETLPNNMRRLSVAMFGDVPVSALLLLYFNKTAEYVIPAILREYRSKQPLSFLIWHGMIDAITKGYTLWNWGGTYLNTKSLYHFKSGFGAIDYPYTYLISVRPEIRSQLSTKLNEFCEAFKYYFIFPHQQVNQNHLLYEVKT